MVNSNDAQRAQPTRFLQRSWGPLTGPIHYEFTDHGEVIEKGIVASLDIVEQRFEAFKAIRPWEAISGE